MSCDSARAVCGAKSEVGSGNSGAMHSPAPACALSARRLWPLLLLFGADAGQLVGARAGSRSRAAHALAWRRRLWRWRP